MASLKWDPNVEGMIGVFNLGGGQWLRFDSYIFIVSLKPRHLT